MGKLYKTEGIALKFIKYRETSIIVKVYTAEFGMKSYIVNGVRSAKGKTNRIALYQPLTLLELVVYNQENRDLNRISEAKVLQPYQSIPFEIFKSSVAIFLTEVLAKALNTEEENPSLFLFLKEHFLKWDCGELSSENFHLFFLMELSEFLGFGVRSELDFLRDLEKKLEITLDTRAAVEQLINTPPFGSISLNGSQRTRILELLIAFYHTHLENFENLKSLEVLKEVMG